MLIVIVLVVLVALDSLHAVWWGGYSGGCLSSRLDGVGVGDRFVLFRLGWLLVGFGFSSSSDRLISIGGEICFVGGVTFFCGGNGGNGLKIVNTGWSAG